MRKRNSIIIRGTIAVAGWLAYDWFCLGGRGMIGGTAVKLFPIQPLSCALDLWAAATAPNLELAEA
jgi:hypothetical protein